MFNFLKRWKRGAKPKVKAGESSRDAAFRAAVLYYERDFKTAVTDLTVLVSEQPIEANKEKGIWVAKAETLAYIEQDQLSQTPAELVWPVRSDDVENNCYQTLPRLTMCQLKVRQHGEVPHVYYVVEVEKTGVQDIRLQPILDDYYSPVFFTSLLGQFKLNKLTDFFVADIEHEGRQLKVLLENGPDNRPAEDAGNAVSLLLMKSTFWQERLIKEVVKNYQIHLSSPQLQSVTILFDKSRMLQCSEAGKKYVMKISQEGQLLSVLPVQ